MYDIYHFISSLLMLKCLNDIIKGILSTSDGHVNGCFYLNVINITFFQSVW